MESRRKAHRDAAWTGWIPALAAALALVACGPGAGPKEDSVPDLLPDAVDAAPEALPEDLPTDAAADLVPDLLPDLVPDLPSDLVPDLPEDVASDLVPDLPSDVPAFPDPPFVPSDSVLRASYATRDLPVPLGISSAGFGQVPPADAPRGPFCDVFQATTIQLHPPRIQVVHLLAGDRRLLLVGGDLAAVLGTLQTWVVRRVLERTGVDVSGSMVFAGNHTHSGPARLYDTPMGPFFSDSYREENFLPVADAIADAIVDSLSHVPLVPVRVGNAILRNADMHAYRRCPQTKVQDDTLHVLRIDRMDGSGTVAVILNYAMHGTVFGFREGVLGGDAPRSVELKVQEVLPGAPPVLYFQSWTGDMAPTDPRETFGPSPWPESPIPALDRLEALGRLAADTVLAGWDEMTWQETPELVVVSAVAPIGVEAIGYAPGEWDHPAGALLCGGGGSICTATPPAMDACVDVDYGWIPDTVRLTAFRLGTLAGVTLPGEPLTPLALELIQQVKMRVRPVWTVMVFGYAHDFVGYLMLPDDWANGGYEPGMAFFGPRQGEYLRDAAASVAGRLSMPTSPLSFSPVAPPAWDSGASVPYTPAVSTTRGTTVQDLPPQATAGEVLTFRWTGGDPWVDRPEVVVQEQVQAGRRGDGFVPVRIGGRVVDQRDYRVLLSVTPEPSWDVAAPAGRVFTWTATVRTAVRIPAPRQAMLGTLRVAVSGHAVSALDVVQEYALTSSPMTVAAPP